MSTFTYQELLSVDILHDYYLERIDDNGSSTWVFPDQYTIVNDLQLVPTAKTSRLLRNMRMLFQPTQTGFRIMVQSTASVLDASEHQTVIGLPRNLRLQFLIEIRNPHFLNFTNLRLSGQGPHIYHFSNNLPGLSSPFLSRTLPNFPDTPDGSNRYQLGDLVRQGGNVHEAITNVASSEPFSTTNFRELPHDATYVSAADRMRVRSNLYRYTAANDTPGETIQFELLNENGAIQDLGLIPNTGQPQGSFTTSAQAENRIVHDINLAAFPSGQYSMRITRAGGTTVEQFYLLQDANNRACWGMLELDAFSGITDYAFAEESIDAILGIRETLLRPRQFQLRFRNRTTVWRYFDQNYNELTYAEDNTNTVTLNRRLRLDLRNQFRFEKFTNDPIYESGAHIGPADFELDPVPDASVALIFPERDASDPELIREVYSEIYLNQP